LASIAGQFFVSKQYSKGIFVSASLYERLGGEVAVNAAVDIFYSKVLADERIKHFFANTDMAMQRAKQKAFLTMAFGGPQNYSGKSMRDGHSHLVKQGLNDSHFDVLVELLGATLKELDVSQDMIAEVAAIAETTRSDVLSK
jgi:hemoglobin